MNIFETERLLLRPWRIEDLNDFFDYASNVNVAQGAGWTPLNNRETSEKILKRVIEGGETWAIEYKINHKVIGSFGIHPDKKRNIENMKVLVYSLAQDYWGKGYMTEVVKRVIKFAFEEMNLDLLSVSHYPFNNRSKRVIEKCGFKYEGTLRLSCKIYDGSVYDELCYSLLKEEYFTNSL